jgi:alkanesulfonate monooxygenase SsuD/methylene tetrahydromethanopterin reductase-like flavin-dependent oxidoreductase (luciferase family)
MKRVARWGDGWQPVALPLPRIQQKLEQLRTLMAETGRDFQKLELSTAVVANVSPTEAKSYQAAGLHTLYMLTTSDQPRELFTQMRQFAGTLREIA